MPSVGQVNALRGNKRYGSIDDEERKLGSCDFEWNSSVAEPPTDKRGEIARSDICELLLGDSAVDGDAY